MNHLVSPRKKNSMKKVLVFGTFDGLHPGHDHFLKEAKKLGDRLIVCLARNATVEELKGKPPVRGELERREALAESDSVDEVIYGDRELGTYQIITDTNPDVIAIGYDQQALKTDLERFLKEQGKQITLVTINSLEPERYKSSLL